MAPARPALLPLLAFVAGSLCAPWRAASCTVLLAALVAAGCFRNTRAFDRILLVLGAALGLLHGGFLAVGGDVVRGNAALTHPVEAPFERSWDATLVESPKAIDARFWRLRTDKMELEVPVRHDSDRTMLAGLGAGDGVRVWARVRYHEPSGTLRGSIKSPQLIERLRPRPIALRHELQRRRDALGQHIRSIYGDGRMAVFLNAVLLGERTRADPVGERRLRAAGLAHLVAISGLHVGIVGGLFLAVMLRGVRHRVTSWIVASIVLVGFGFMVGWGVPVRRAVAGMVLALAGRAIGRDGDALNRLACVAAVLVWFVPSGFTNPGFALSFAATAGILLSGSGTCGVRMSCGAYLATAPMCGIYFGQFAPWAPAANLLAVPFVTVLLVAGYSSLLLFSVPVLGGLATTLTRLSFLAIDGIARGFDALPASPWFVSRPPGWLVATVALAGLAPAFPVGVHARRAAGLVFALGIVALHLGPPPRSPVNPEVRLLDVGQGQSLVWSDDRQVTLVDAGGRGYGRWDPGAAVVRPALLDGGLRHIHRLVLSHGDADHAAGALAVIDSFEIGELWLGPGWWRHDRLAEIAARARRRGSAIRLVHHGVAVPGIRVVAPAREGPVAHGNAGSIALILGYPPSTLLAPGDLDGDALTRAIESGVIEPATALVLPHHGSRLGTTSRLLERVAPTIAIASCGWRNRFGHPHRESLDNLNRVKVPLWRTDHHGTLTLTAGDAGWAVSISPRSSRGTR